MQYHRQGLTFPSSFYQRLRECQSKSTRAACDNVHFVP